MNFSQYDRDQKARFVEYFSEHISQNKLTLFDKVIAQRSNYITAVVENIYAEQNATAIVRTSECLGLQSLHIIEENNAFKIPKKMASGAGKWIHINRYHKNEQNTAQIINSIRAKGYKIVCTSPSSQDFTPHSIPIDSKLAIFFGEEEPGLSQEMMQHADYLMNVPMSGFTESLNVSVCAGIVLGTLVHRLKDSQISWQLSLEEQLDLKLEWMCHVVKGGKEMLTRLV